MRLLGWRIAWVGSSWIVRPRYLVLVRDLAAPLPEPSRRSDLRWAPLATDEVARLATVDPRLTAAEIRRRLAEGQECHLCWVGESIAHYRWEATRPAYLPYLGLTVRPLPGDVCGAGLFTHPIFRRSGIHTAATLWALHRLRARGFRHAIAFVAWWNAASLRVEREWAERTVAGAVGYWNLGPRRGPFAEGAVGWDEPGVTFHVAARDRNA
jgi:hypothetical protein